MKSMIDYMVTMIVLTVMSFVLVGIMMSEVQIINARNYHTAVIEDLQSKYDYGSDLYTIRKQELINKGFEFKEKSDRVEITYTFDIDIPFIGAIKDNKIVGYAR